MASKGRIPPPHLRRPLPGSGIVHPDSFGSGLHLPQGPFPPFEMLPPPEVMEQKIAAQHAEMQRLATENQRLAATHGTLRQELAAAQHELQLLHAHIGAVKAEREQQMRGLVDNIGKMETELKDAEPVRLELQQARVEAENLLVTRQELVSKIHQLSQDLHRAQVDVQQIPALMSELEGLRQEYQRCRVSYDYEKKLFHDHLEQLQTMEKNYITMSRELEKLRSELTKTANVDIRNGGPYGGPAGNESEASGHPTGKNIYEDGYGIPQSQGHPALHNSGAANIGAVGNASAGTATPYSGAQSGAAPSKPGYEAPRGPAYEPPKVPGYDASRLPGYDMQRGHGYDAQRGPGYDAHRVPGYDPQRLAVYDIQRGHAYDAQRGQGYDAQRLPNYHASRGAAGPQGHVAPLANNMPYGSATPPTHSGSGYEAPARGVAGPHGQVAAGNNMPFGSATPPTRSGSVYEASARAPNPARR
ncbi:PREDICTED: protein FLX-like 2 isoform X2 [Populus euphratica]|uniref:Protein FLX-like 2 isoform X2 n=1 Tax=Populus euphratica TaxID=75702 RepID=A0AAJ6XJE8_POPEU|nr:PREDICTED: protein FLX-like 2 isoform X2 [Populus euphratica]